RVNLADPRQADVTGGRLEARAILRPATDAELVVLTCRGTELERGLTQRGGDCPHAVLQRERGEVDLERDGTGLGEQGGVRGQAIGEIDHRAHARARQSAAGSE